MKNGTPINDIDEIPDTEFILFASRSPFFKGFRRVVTRQRSQRSNMKLLNGLNFEDNDSEQVENKDIPLVTLLFTKSYRLRKYSKK